MPLQDILKKIRPTKVGRREIGEFVSEILRVAKTISGLDSVVCGSIGKFTWLRGDHDIDLFILFPKRVSREDLEKNGLLYGKKIVSALKGKYIIKYAEHPYVHARINGFDVDIVPCYRIKKGEEIKSAVDRSPLHLEYILERLNPGLRDDVRLLKQFCKGIGVYGSDAKNLGFSGYMCELLVIRYGTFKDVLMAASKWVAPQIIDVENLRKINTKKFHDQPLIIIDPTDPNRNVAANLSGKNFIKFVFGAKRFLEKPTEEYFFPKKPKALSKGEIKSLQNRGTKFLAIRFSKPDLIDDVLYPQLRRALKRLEGLLRHNEFYLMRGHEFVSSKNVILLFELETWSLPEIKKMIGPPIFSKKHSKEFLTKYKNCKPFIGGTKWVIEKERENKTASRLLKNFLRKRVKELRDSGIPENIAREFGKAKLLEHEDFWKFVEENKEFSSFLREMYFGEL